MKSKISVIQVVRVKNRYDNARGAAAGGYRDLSLNLRVTSVEAQELGVDGHVCEVQLILQSFHELKVKNGISELKGQFYSVVFYTDLNDGSIKILSDPNQVIDVTNCHQILSD